jgi:hypothetical protein
MDEVIHFDKSGANAVSLEEFCGEKSFEVRIYGKKELKYRRAPQKIVQFARECIGELGYDTIQNNCLDFVNRITFR